MSSSVELENKQGVVTLWMNRPEVHNAFDEGLIGDLQAAFERLAGDDSARVVVLAGRGKSFSAGADLGWMKRAATYSFEENKRDADRLAGMLRTIARFPKPTIARVQGAALGGGAGLTAVCDIAVASTAAVFAMSEVRFGITPATISPYVVRAIGARQARRYFQTAERIDAQRAFALGLVHEVVTPEALDAAVVTLVEALLQGGPKAQTAAKDLIAAVENREITDALIDDTAQRIASIRATPEAREGLAAFLEKRVAAWRLS